MAKNFLCFALSVLIFIFTVSKQKQVCDLNIFYFYLHIFISKQNINTHILNTKLYIILGYSFIIEKKFLSFF